MIKKMSQFISFNNGLQMPLIGLGTWRAPDTELQAALNTALEVGYRHIDAAPVYFNEKIIGNTLKNWFDSGKLKREEIFICTKLPFYGNRPSTVEKYLKKSLSDLQLDYVDLYLVHTPFTIPETEGDFLFDDNGDIVLDKTDQIGTWKKMEEMVDAGLVKSIGLSNFNKNQIQRIVDNSRIKPVNLQIEVHLYLQQNELVKFCKDNDISVTAYSPLGSKGIDQMYKGTLAERTIPDLMENPEVISIAKRLGKTPAQILLRYTLQRGVAIIPKSTNAGRLRQNLELFDFTLSDEDMKLLESFDKGIRICDFSFFKGLNKHPEFPW